METKSTTPLLTIVTVTLHAPDALQETLLSLLPLLREEPQLRFEWLVVDSSPEENETVLNQHRLPLPCNRLIQAPHGIYSAQNFGLAAAKGELVWFLNGGDRLHSSRSLAQAVSSLEENKDAAFLIAGAALFRGGQYLYTQAPHAGLFGMLGINRTCHQAVIYRRAFLNRFGPFAEKFRLAADYELHLRAHAAGERVMVSDETLVDYDMGGQSSQTKAALQEFAAVHAELNARDLLRWATLHTLVRRVEEARIGIYKTLGSSAAGPGLRQLRNGLLRLRQKGRQEPK